MSLRSGQVVASQFTVSSPATGGAADADSLPTGTLVVNGDDNGAAVTVTHKATGVYKWSVTLPTLALGDRVDVRIQAIVSGATGKKVYPIGSRDPLVGSDGKVMLSNDAGAVPAVALAAIAGAASGAGTGDIIVDEDTGGADNLLVEIMGSGVGNVQVRAFLKTDWDAGHRDIETYCKGQIVTDSDGAWASPMHLAAGQYVFDFDLPGTTFPTKTVTVS
jgi:hypothetical protein